MGTASRINGKNGASLPTMKSRRKSGTAVRERKAIAKIGMTASLGALFASGFLKFHGAKSLHLCSGFGLLAFTVWHHLLNQPGKKPKRSSPVN